MNYSTRGTELRSSGRVIIFGGGIIIFGEELPSTANAEEGVEDNGDGLVELAGEESEGEE